MRRSIKKLILKHDPKVVAAVTVIESKDFKQPEKKYLATVIIYNGIDNVYNDALQQVFKDLLVQRFQEITFVSIDFNRTFLLNPKLTTMFKGNRFSRSKLWK